MFLSPDERENPMKHRVGRCLTLAWRLALAGCLSASALADEFVLTNARAYTLDPERPWADTVVIVDGRIAAVFDEPTAPDDPSVPVIDLGGRMLLPAFQDTHVHPASGGVLHSGCSLYDLDGPAAILAAVRACVAADPEAPLIRGSGWNMADFPEGEPPHKALLDAIDDTRPLVFDDADGHALWLNSRALETYGITALTPDPPGGLIARIEGSREPRGSLHETAAELVRERWPAYTEEEIRRGLRYGLDYLHAMGITAFQDAYVPLVGDGEIRSLPAYLALAEAGELGMRVSLALAWLPGGGEAHLQRLLATRAAHHGKSYENGELHLDMVKFWADGVVETRTAMLLEPYSDQPGTRGLMMIPREELVEWVTRVDAEGFQVHIHAIGDATVRYALDALEAAQGANGRRDARHHLNHVQFVHPDDIGRFAKLGVGATFEPYWAYEDTYITELTRPRVGEERIRTSYPIRSILDTGARVAFSSDWSVSTANPLLGIETAVTRVDPHSNEGEPFLPEQRITLAEAIAAYTRDAAWMNGFEDTTGTIEPGKFADLVVLGQDLFAIPVQDVSEVRIEATLFEGRVVHGALPRPRSRPRQSGAD